MLARVVLPAAALVAAVAGSAAAADWGTIIPGESTQEAVRARYGAPTRTLSQKVEGYDTVQWVYDGAQAPVGLRRMIVDFGLATPGGYRPQVVRTFRIEPKHGVFSRATILSGWGSPTRLGTEGEAPVYFYQEGLVVYFDKQGQMATLMVFLPRQPPSPEPARPRP